MTDRSAFASLVVRAERWLEAQKGAIAIPERADTLVRDLLALLTADAAGVSDGNDKPQRPAGSQLLLVPGSVLADPDLDALIRPISAPPGQSALGRSARPVSAEDYTVLHGRGEPIEDLDLDDAIRSRGGGHGSQLLSVGRVVLSAPCPSTMHTTCRYV